MNSFHCTQSFRYLETAAVMLQGDLAIASTDSKLGVIHTWMVVSADMQNAKFVGSVRLPCRIQRKFLGSQPKAPEKVVHKIVENKPKVSGDQRKVDMTGVWNISPGNCKTRVEEAQERGHMDCNQHDRRGGTARAL